MPRFYNYEASTHEMGAQALDPIHLGHGEVSMEQIEAEGTIPGINHSLTMGRNHQFSLQNSISVFKNEAELNQVFIWLEEHATGPWHW